ncbi:GCN5 family acetyltransferase [Nostoc linckia z18]|jgi:predicted N-acetyltransferase YhbS|uniref:GCN5 family acetyltransferase n=2 Tax=Nostoc linckia TaxID=92942 RepID=A0A9Q6EM95_NOSLI|nr:GNAT family N-acetyltransferase [Nostoc linckia]PHK40058.1 GCN5 family acetyltransferase [Nostoc linckia z15]PHK47026.1 GCN5 family acetyltransferase [Nostoc linckia z16]PHJ61545.1 GCN5 family acetyltransferase [Nostoc linckia z1]PHJ65825.1 GCN5 family acetyltransferase [Nostoc linckia z3]PHJ72109.1 GCN5 family acetyltransferase [Nostoc linckia z2]
MSVSIRLLQENELAAADHIFRLAFGTFIGLPEPTEFYGDAAYIHHRWKANPNSVFAAEIDGKLIGSNLAIDWGSFGYFGPLSVHPDFWNQKVGQHLVEAAIAYLTEANTSMMGLFTFAQSPKHHILYQKFGFRLRFLTAILAKKVEQLQPIPQRNRYSLLSENERAQTLEAIVQLSNSIYEGLDLSREIQTVQAQGLGDTVLLWNDTGLSGFAVCHYGPGTEAGSNTCFVRFGAVYSGNNAGERFEELLDLCEALTVAQGMSRLIAGVNTSRDEAYRRMLARGFRSEIIGVAMHRPNEPGFNRPDVFAVDDWR